MEARAIKMQKNNNSDVGIPSNLHPTIIQNENGYCVYLSEWRVSGIGETLDDAYKQFQENLQLIQLNNSKFGIAYLTPESYPTIRNGDVKKDLMLFLIKVAACVFVSIALFIALLPMINAALKNTLKQSTQGIISAESRDPRYWAVKFPTDINARLDTMTPEEREKMFKEWNQLITRTSLLWKPLKCN
jgi:hypothetical protein